MHPHIVRALRLPRLASAALAASLLACSAGEPASGTTAASAGQAASAIESAPGSPVSALVSGGTFWFVLDESDVADDVKTGCAKGSADASAAAACVDRIRREGAKEGIRFSGSDPARLVWTSFGVGGGAEEVFLEVPFAVTAVDRARVQVRATGAPRGSRVPPKVDALRTFAFEVIDADTVAMVDPERGRMIFRAH